MIRRKDLYTALADSAFRYPEKVALVEAGTKRSITYRELLVQVDRIADMLFEHGIRKGDRVAVAHRNSINVVATNFGLYKLGAVCIPMNFMVTKPSIIVKHPLRAKQSEHIGLPSRIKVLRLLYAPNTFFTRGDFSAHLPRHHAKGAL